MKMTRMILAAAALSVTVAANSKEKAETAFDAKNVLPEALVIKERNSLKNYIHEVSKASLENLLRELEASKTGNVNFNVVVFEPMKPSFGSNENTEDEVTASIPATVKSLTSVKNEEAERAVAVDFALESLTRHLNEMR